MIKSEAGIVTINGYGLNVIFECDHLVRAFIEDNPEIIAAVIYKNSERLHDVIPKCDPDKLQAIEDYIDHIQQIRENIHFSGALGIFYHFCHVAFFDGAIFYKQRKHSDGIFVYKFRHCFCSIFTQIVLIHQSVFFRYIVIFFVI